MSILSKVQLIDLSKVLLWTTLVLFPPLVTGFVAQWLRRSNPDMALGGGVLFLFAIVALPCDLMASVWPSKSLRIPAAWAILFGIVFAIFLFAIQAPLCVLLVAL